MPLKIGNIDFVLNEKFRKVMDMDTKRRHISIPKYFTFQSKTNTTN